MNYNACLAILAEKPEIFRGTHGWGETLNRLRVIGFIKGDNHNPEITPKGIAYCLSQKIKTPAQWAYERELKARKDRACNILEGRPIDTNRSKFGYPKWAR